MIICIKNSTILYNYFLYRRNSAVCQQFALPMTHRHYNIFLTFSYEKVKLNIIVTTKQIRLWFQIVGLSNLSAMSFPEIGTVQIEEFC